MAIDDAVRAFVDGGAFDVTDFVDGALQRQPLGQGMLAKVLVVRDQALGGNFGMAYDAVSPARHFGSFLCGLTFAAHGSLLTKRKRAFDEGARKGCQSC